MSLAGIQTTNVLPINARQIFFHQRGQDIRQLSHALNNGDLAGAQQAYASLLSLAKQNSGATTTDSDAAAALFRNPKVASDFAALGQALLAGDLAGAQAAFAAFRQDARNGRPQSAQQPAANAATPEIVINLSGILPSNNGASQSGTDSSATPPGVRPPMIPVQVPAQPRPQRGKLHLHHLALPKSCSTSLAVTDHLLGRK